MPLPRQNRRSGPRRSRFPLRVVACGAALLSLTGCPMRFYADDMSHKDADLAACRATATTLVPYSGNIHSDAGTRAGVVKGCMQDKGYRVEGF